MVKQVVETLHFPSLARVLLQLFQDLMDPPAGERLFLQAVPVQVGLTWGPAFSITLHNQAVNSCPHPWFKLLAKQTTVNNIDLDRVTPPFFAKELKACLSWTRALSLARAWPTLPMKVSSSFL